MYAPLCVHNVSRARYKSNKWPIGLNASESSDQHWQHVITYMWPKINFRLIPPSFCLHQLEREKEEIKTYDLKLMVMVS